MHESASISEIALETILSTVHYCSWGGSERRYLAVAEAVLLLAVRMSFRIQNLRAEMSALKRPRLLKAHQNIRNFPRVDLVKSFRRVPVVKVSKMKETRRAAAILSKRQI